MNRADSMVKWSCRSRVRSRQLCFPERDLGQHRFAVGEYVTVTDEDGRPLTYKVVEVQAA